MSTDRVTIHFDGHELTCRQNTSLAVALWEQGIRVLSHSPKYGRPRGLHCARGHCTSCLLRVDGVPNVRSCLTQVREGMRVERQDAGAFYGRPMQKVLDTADALLPVGFYFKWFTRPVAISRLFLKSLRPIAGVGRLPEPSAWQRIPVPDANATATCSTDWGLFDAVIVGAGASGLIAASRATGRLLIVDDHPEPGGQRQSAFDLIARSFNDGLKSFPMLGAARLTLERAREGWLARKDGEGVTRCLGSRVVAGYHPDRLVLRLEDGLVTLRTRGLTWAAGALDAIGLFPGNDQPGLFGPRALYRLLGRDGMIVHGQRAVVCGDGLDLWLTATLLHARGARVTVVLARPDSPQEVAAAMSQGWQIHIGLRLASVRLQGDDTVLYFIPPDEGHSPVELDCDFAIVCHRAKPAYDVLYQLGADLVLEPERGGYLPDGVREGRYRSVLPGGLQLEVAGEAAGLPPQTVLVTDQKEPLP